MKMEFLRKREKGKWVFKMDKEKEMGMRRRHEGEGGVPYEKKLRSRKKKMRKMI